MSEDLESRLRSALRPAEPSAPFSRRLLGAIHGGLAAKPLRSRFLKFSGGWMAAGLAASIILAVGVGQQIQHQREQRHGQEARRAVLQALQVTSQKLDLAYAAVKSESTSLSDGQTGV